MKVLITGASGNLGEKAAQHLSKNPVISLVLLDRKVDGARTVVPADLAHWDERWVTAFSGVDTVIHLAGEHRVHARWNELESGNIDALLNVIDACEQHQVKNIVFASSLHAMQDHSSEKRRRYGPMATARVNQYGLSKVVGERMLRSFARRSGASVICLRIGFAPPGPNPTPAGRRSMQLQSRWLSNADFCRAIDACLQSQNIKYGVFEITSGNSTGPWDVAPATRDIGYRPKDGIRTVPMSVAKRSGATLRRLRTTLSGHLRKVMESAKKT